MKIKKRDLIQIIREMAYMGVKKTQKGESPYGYHRSTDPDKLEKLFTNKKFKRQADLFFGETKAFPGSNVIIIPAVGSFDWSEGSKSEEGYKVASQFEIFQKTSARVTFYELNEQTMKGLLGLSQEEIEEIDSSKDVVLYVFQGQIDKDFNATVHMVFHSFFEGIIDLLEEDTMSNYLPATRKVLEYLNSITGPRIYGQITKNLEINTIGSIRTNATKHLRGKDTFKKIGAGDFFSEILTASFLRYSGAKNEVLYDDKNSLKYGEVNPEETENLKMLLRDSANEITNFARGKILLISVYE